MRSGPASDVVAAFKEIAAAGAAGRAEFIARGDGSGTSIKERQVWALTGLPLDTNSEPGTPGTTTTAPWYHTTGAGQANMLRVADQCPYTSGGCYSFSDRGTVNNLVSKGTIPTLSLASQNNSGPGAVGGPDLLLNPYHAYAVNPAKVAGVNLPGALAFLNYLTSAQTQAAIGTFPSAAAPAFLPDAYPVVTVSGLPLQAVAGSPVTLTGTVRPTNFLDPPVAGATVQVRRAGDPTATLVTTTTGPDGSFRAAFRPEVTDTYTVSLPQSLDGLITPTRTSYRQATTATVGRLAVSGATTIAVAPHSKPFVHGRSAVRVRLTGRTPVLAVRDNPGVRVQVRKAGTKTFRTASARLALAKKGDGFGWSITVALPTSGTWEVRAEYTDTRLVTTAYSKVIKVVVR